MPSLVPISRDSHAGKAWLRYTSCRFAAKRALIPLVAAELANAALAMPLAFVEGRGTLHVVAVTSLDPEGNQFVGADGRWLGGYIPAALRGYPFMLLRPEGAPRPVLYVDEDSGLVVDAGVPGAEPFFDGGGMPAPALQLVIDFLGQLEANRAATKQSLAAIAEAGVLTPWSLQVDTPTGSRSVTGLQRVDEARLNALDDHTFLGLRAAGGLAVAYAQLLSMGQLGVFETLTRLQAQISKVHAQQQAAFDGSLEPAASEGLQFDLSIL